MLSLNIDELTQHPWGKMAGISRWHYEMLMRVSMINQYWFRYWLRIYFIWWISFDTFEFWTNMPAYDWQHFQMHDFERKYLYFNFNFPWGKSVTSKHYLDWSFVSYNLKIYREIITNHSYQAELKVSRIFYCPACNILFFFKTVYIWFIWNPIGWQFLSQAVGYVRVLLELC